MARELSIWTTREHRRFAEVDVVFHAADPPNALDAVREEAATLIARLHGAMKKRPVDHARHVHWVFGVEAWLTRRQASMNSEAGTPLPPECGPLYPERGLFHPAGIRNAYLELLGRMRRLAGVKPNVPIWHHGWLDSRLVLSWIKSVTREHQDEHNLFICTAYSPLSQSLEKTGVFDIIHARELMDDQGLAQSRETRAGATRYGNVLCHVYRADVRETRQILERLTPLLEQGATVGVYVDHEGYDTDPSDFSSELGQYVDWMFPADWTGLSIRTSFAGGLAKRRLRSMESRLLRCLWPATWKRALGFPFVPLLWPAVAGLTAINNWRFRNGFISCPPYCSSALLNLSRPAAPAETRARAVQ